MGKKIVYQINYQNNLQYAENKRVRTNQNTTKFLYQPSNDMGQTKLKYTSLYEFFFEFPNEESARKYFEKKRWNGRVRCPHCGSDHITECRITLQCLTDVGNAENFSESDLVQF